jgi:hypothetical protein
LIDSLYIGVPIESGIAPSHTDVLNFGI